MILTLPDLSRESLGKAFHQIVDAPLDKNKRYYLTLEDKPPSYTDQQRKWYFGVLLPPLCAEVGCTKDELHRDLGLIFRQYEYVDKLTGELMQGTRSITTYKKAEMTEYLELVIRWAAETFPDCRLPEEIL